MPNLCKLILKNTKCTLEVFN